MNLGTVKHVSNKFFQFCSEKVNLTISSDHSRSIAPNLKNILCQLNNLSEQDTNGNENLPNCKYRDVSYFSNFDFQIKMPFIFPS